MEAVVSALAELVAEQGKQIVELAKALAIAHEHHAMNAAPAPDPFPAFERPDKLWMTEAEEEAEFNRTAGTGEHLSRESADAFLRESGIDPSTLSVAP